MALELLLVVSFCIVDAVSNVFILLKLENVEKIISGKTKSMIGIILKLFAQLIFVEKIIEYMSVPASDENRFMILASIIVIFCMNFAAFLFVKNMLILNSRYGKIRIAIRYADFRKIEFPMNPVLLKRINVTNLIFCQYYLYYRGMHLFKK